MIIGDCKICKSSQLLNNKSEEFVVTREEANDFKKLLNHLRETNERNKNINRERRKDDEIRATKKTRFEQLIAEVCIGKTDCFIFDEKIKEFLISLLNDLDDFFLEEFDDIKTRLK